MELFRIIKSDAKRAMGFCGGRITAAIMIIALFALFFSVTESLLLFIFEGPETIYYNIESIIKGSPKVLAITAAMAVIWLFIIPALFIGYQKLCLSFAEGNDERVSLIFDSFSSLKKFVSSAVFAFIYIIKIALTFGIGILPGGALFWFCEKYLPDTEGGTILKTFGCLVALGILVLCVFLSIIFIQRWSLAVYYKAAGAGIHKSFMLSAKATKGCCTEVLSFKCSFMGWAFLSFLILPMLWSVPYYSISFAIFAKYLMERYERSLAEVPEIPEEPIAEETN